MKKTVLILTTLILTVAILFSFAACNPTGEQLKSKYADAIEQEMRGSFDFFWKEAQTSANYPNAYGLVPDRASEYATGDVASIASVGFGLAAYVVGAEEGYVTKAEAMERTVGTLKTVKRLQESDTAVSHEGFLTHFVDMKTGARANGSEISSIDTAIMLCGALTAGEYFGGEVKTLAEEIYANVNWTAMRINKGGQKCIAMTFAYNNGQFGSPVTPWDFYAEQLMIYVLGAGSPTEAYRLDDAEYYAFTRKQGVYKGHKFYYSWFGSIFTYQFSHAFVDFNGLVDKKGTDWWDNSLQASLAAYEYCRDNANKYETYAKGGWGLTACDVSGGYSGKLGAEPRGWNSNEDASYSKIAGTVAPCGAIGSVVFTPEQSLKALKYYQTDKTLSSRLNGKYGLLDSYNLEPRWFAGDYIGIDKGISIVMLANYKSGSVWEQFMANQYVTNGLRALGIDPIATPN